MAWREDRRRKTLRELCEELESTTIHKKHSRIALATACILLVPLVAMQFSEEWNWDLFDFAFMGTLLFCTGLAYELLARRAGTIAYRAAVGVGLAAAFILVWVNAAVGIIGDGEEDLASLMYVGGVLVAILGPSSRASSPEWPRVSHDARQAWSPSSRG